MIGLWIGVVSFISTFGLYELPSIYLSQIYVYYWQDLVFALAAAEVVFHIVKWGFYFFVMFFKMFLTCLLMNCFFYSSYLSLISIIWFSRSSISLNIPIFFRFLLFSWAIMLFASIVWHLSLIFFRPAGSLKKLRSCGIQTQDLSVTSRPR